MKQTNIQNKSFELSDRLFFQDLEKFSKPKPDFIYVGKIKGVDDIPDLHLVNCNICKTTIQMTAAKELKHLKNQHYSRYWEVQQQYNNYIAKQFLKYITQ